MWFISLQIKTLCGILNYGYNLTVVFVFIFINKKGITLFISQKSKADFLCGLRQGIPIALGYLSVSFGFGITAANEGLSPWIALLISMTNLTSAGQVAGLSIIVAGGSYFEIALAEFIINLRYALMSLALSQKADKTLTTPHRLTTAFGITDEIFAVASGRYSEVSCHFLYGLILLPFLGWSAGTLCGGIAGNILPARLCSALGIAIYGMFFAIIIPPSRDSRGILTVVLLAAALSCAIKYIPLFAGISTGFSIIICGVISAVVGAVFFPQPNSDDTDGGEKR